MYIPSRLVTRKIRVFRSVTALWVHGYCPVAGGHTRTATDEVTRHACVHGDNKSQSKAIFVFPRFFVFVVYDGYFYVYDKPAADWPGRREDNRLSSPT